MGYDDKKNGSMEVEQNGQWTSLYNASQNQKAQIEDQIRNRESGHMPYSSEEGINDHHPSRLLGEGAYKVFAFLWRTAIISLALVISYSSGWMQTMFANSMSRSGVIFIAIVSLVLISRPIVEIAAGLFVYILGFVFFGLIVIVALFLVSVLTAHPGNSSQPPANVIQHAVARPLVVMHHKHRHAGT